MFPTRYKAKISKLMSYPIGAEAISAALADVPQSGKISLRFGPSAYATILRPSHAPSYKVLSAVYRHHSHSQFSPTDWVSRGNYEPQWEIHIHEVPRVHRHVVRSLLLNDALPRLADWFRDLASIVGQEGSCNMIFTFDETQQLLTCDSSNWTTPTLARRDRSIDGAEH